MARSSQLRKLRGSLGGFVVVETNKLALAVMNNLIADPPKGTPQDTLFAQSNWLMSLDGPSTDLIGTKAQAKASGPDFGPQESSIKRIRVTTGAGRSSVTGRFELRKIYISNNAPYIGLLNKGSSRQSPAGWVDRAILKGQQSAAASSRRRGPGGRFV